MPVLERCMWHGTRTNNPASIYDSPQGWDVKYSKQGSLGTGSYFAFSPEYCKWSFSSSAPGVPGRQLFLADVLTDIGAKFTFRVDEGYLDSWVLCGKLMLGVHKTSRTLTYQDGPYDKFVLLGRLEWEIQMFFEAAKWFKDDDMIDVLDEHIHMQKSVDIVNERPQKAPRRVGLHDGSQDVWTILDQEVSSPPAPLSPASTPPSSRTTTNVSDYPAFWDESLSPMQAHLIDVPRQSAEWNDVMKQTQGHLGNQVLRIQRIQNANLWAKYKRQRDRLYYTKYLTSHVRINETCSGAVPVLERRMWHGTRTNNPASIYDSAQGWDVKYSRKGSLGTGSYFAFSPEYCKSRFSSVAPGMPGRQLFLADVLTGAMGTKHNSMTPDDPWFALLRNPFQEPEWDSVGNNAMAVVNFRIPESAQKVLAYPRYLVTYEHVYPARPLVARPLAAQAVAPQQLVESRMFAQPAAFVPPVPTQPQPQMQSEVFLGEHTQAQLAQPKPQQQPEQQLTTQPQAMVAQPQAPVAHSPPLAQPTPIVPQSGQQLNTQPLASEQHTQPAASCEQPPPGPEFSSETYIESQLLAARAAQRRAQAAAEWRQRFMQPHIQRSQPHPPPQLQQQTQPQQLAAQPPPHARSQGNAMAAQPQASLGQQHAQPDPAQFEHTEPRYHPTPFPQHQPEADVPAEALFRAPQPFAPQAATLECPRRYPAARSSSFAQPAAASTIQPAIAAAATAYEAHSGDH